MVRFYLPFLIGMLLFAACGTPKKAIYFTDSVGQDSATLLQSSIAASESVIQPDDILAINVTSISSMTTENPSKVFNEGGTPFSVMPISGGISAGGAVGGQNSGYLVDRDGMIDFPVLGKLHVSGMTVRQAKDLMVSKLKDYLKEPVVEIRIINYKIVVLGEVQRPGTVLAPNQKINIIEAISAAGDIPVTGRKDNIMIIRQNGEQREFGRVNLNSRDLFQSPYFYLRQNDIVIVEASRVRRQESNEFLRLYLPVFSSLLSTALAVYGLVQLSK